ncbi:MAG: CCA tRNA nucleotidyltransferase [Acidobacteriaceae bacterium]|nr:CCA tRNA nucleotidyltransferase [Acidobacteriaceae bacterium]MBV9779759.1 CCA tRNA nucleotidyltransferase [Acidobacteriaceae bacterium]
MSDYMFVLDSHLSSEQSKLLSEIRQAADRENLNLFLTGGAMRDMMGGFPIRDLDFTLEGGSTKFIRTVAKQTKAEILNLDENRKAAELRFGDNVSASISLAHQERFPKPGGKPHVELAIIHDDLRCRDFTINAIALSLNRASRGLLLDPTNGLGDLSRKEIRAVSNYTLYDDPSRILRMIRLRVRLGFTIEERTLSQYQNVREAKLETKIPRSALEHELAQIALDPLAGDILKALEDENLLYLISPALSGPKLNLLTFQKLQKGRQVLTSGVNLRVEHYPLFLFVLFEKLSSRERSQLVAALDLPRRRVDAAMRLEAKAKKIEKELATAKLQRPSALYQTLSKVPGEILLFLLMRSGQRLVVDRVKNYLQKYLPAAQEITEKDVLERGAQPGTPKFAKLHQQMIAARLDARPKKVVVEEPPPLPPLSGRRSASFGR